MILSGLITSAMQNASPNGCRRLRKLDLSVETVMVQGMMQVSSQMEPAIPVKEQEQLNC